MLIELMPRYGWAFNWGNFITSRSKITS